MIGYGHPRGLAREEDHKLGFRSTTIERWEWDFWTYFDLRLDCNFEHLEPHSAGFEEEATADGSFDLLARGISRCELSGREVARASKETMP